jgi:hypothetical protein
MEVIAARAHAKKLLGLEASCHPVFELCSCFTNNGGGNRFGSGGSSGEMELGTNNGDENRSGFGGETELGLRGNASMIVDLSNSSRDNPHLSNSSRDNPNRLILFML